MIARRRLMIAGLLGGALGLAGQAPTAVAQLPKVAPEAAKLRDELMALEKGSWGFMKDKNFDGMRNFLADDVLLIFGDGSRFNKREMLEMMKDFALLDLKIEPTYALRLISPDVANLIYRVTYTSTLKGGKPETLSARASSVYVNRGGKWWSVFYQETPIK